MNTSNILNLAGKYIADLKEIEENVYKGTLSVSDKIAGVYYFDLNNKPLKNFDEYQEQLLADEFYKNPGNLQWNYYLFLLNDYLETSTKESIERNDKYARKYVLTESEFEDFFTVEKSGATIKPNIVESWKKQLDESGLKEVYSMKTYVDIISKFKSSGQTKIEQVITKPKIQITDRISFINKIILGKNYRNFPVKRDYDFGKVNLFRGINGVGKTSLFEAIEAMVCGKCLRNPSDSIPQKSIISEFNHSGKLSEFDGKNNSLFQSRNLNWYSINSRSNTLYSSFNRFNFFNADAAHNFSNAKNEKEASDALFSIVLGPEYQYISDRCQGTLDRLRPEYNKLAEQMRNAKEIERSSSIIIKNYKESLTLVQLREAVLKTYDQLRFNQTTNKDDLAQIENYNNKLRSVLSTLSTEENTITTLSKAEEAYRDNEKKRYSLEENERAIREANEQLSKQSIEKQRLNNFYDFLSRCIEFVRDQKLMNLDGLKFREGELNLTKSKIQFVKELLKDLNEDTNSIILPLDKLEFDLNLLNENLKISELKMESIMDSLNKLDSIIKQIKLHGKEFIEKDHNAKICPLCQARYERSELVNRIITESENLNSTNPTELDDLHNNMSRTKDLILEKEKCIEEQKRIVQALLAAFPDQTFTDLKKGLESLFEFIAQENQVFQRLREISAIKNYADELGHTEKEYNELKFACSQQLGDDSVFKYGNVENFQNLLDQTLKDLSVCDNKIKGIETNRSEIGNEIKKLLGVEGSSLYLRDIREIFQKQQANIFKIKESFASLQEIIVLNNDISINYLLELSNTLVKNISSLREEQKIQFQFETAKKENAEAKDFIDKNSSQLAKFDKGVSTLRSLTGDEASRHVSEFFKENFKEVFDIFKSIHVPKEFKALKFNNDRLELITLSDETRTTSQISTGQRSALAISIFLALNSKLVNGPDIIMFDDPVAFIDDLNALSFLDHLRLHTLKSGKQIFFATANMRLAGLFEKKFGFLDKDFKSFELKRTKYSEEIN